MKGLVVFSFALAADTNDEPNPCNSRLAEETVRIVLDEEDAVTVVAQWEVARALECRVPVAHIVEPQEEGYLDSDEVMRQAAEVFRQRNITEVIPVANSFLHLRKCRELVREHGFQVAERRIGKIGFWPDSAQWWTRGPVRLFVYAVLRKLTGRRGK